MKLFLLIVFYFFGISVNAAEKNKIDCAGSKSPSKCFQLGQDYINDSQGDYIKGLNYVNYACMQKIKQACSFEDEKLAEFNIQIAKCNQSLNYRACERFIYQCNNYKTAHACGVVGHYWIKQNDSFMAIDYFEKVCDYGDTNGCKIVGDLKQQSEKNRAIQKQQDEYREQAESKRREQNIINVLRGASEVLSK